jgi:hypothetical protein
MKRKRYEITSQAELRRLFWREHPGINRERFSFGFVADTRAAWVDWIDGLQKAGVISEALTFRATLD